MPPLPPVKIEMNSKRRRIPPKRLDADADDAEFRFHHPNKRSYVPSKVSMSTISWLKEHFTTKDALHKSLPRALVYHLYTVDCVPEGEVPTSSPCFGKAIKSAFPDITTRRIGVRGQSKYHYAGLSFSQSSPLRHHLVATDMLYPELDSAITKSAEAFEDQSSPPVVVVEAVGCEHSTECDKCRRVVEELSSRLEMLEAQKAGMMS